MQSRRRFLANTIKCGVGLPLWLKFSQMEMMAQTTADYKAIVCLSLPGGNDSNNMLIPTSGNEYKEYQALRGSLAIPVQQIIPLSSSGAGYTLGLHPSLPGVAALFNAGKASLVANVGPLGQPLTKSQITANPALLPSTLLNHTVGEMQWHSASTELNPTSGWGGRIADALTGRSGSLPMVLNAGSPSIFTAGVTVQGITVQGGNAIQSVLPADLQDAALQLAVQDSTMASNLLVAQAATLRAASWNQQMLIAQAVSAGDTLKTVFPTGQFGTQLSTVAKMINGRSTLGASRQIFYLTQGGYDTHSNQLGNHASSLSDLDGGLTAFVQALREAGLMDSVLICTSSDFGRTMKVNSSAGTDHAWGSHQLILGGGIKGGKIIGSMPDLELAGSSDYNTSGTWIPTTSVTQMAAGIASWFGLSTSQVNQIFPDLVKFPQGAIGLA